MNRFLAGSIVAFFLAASLALHNVSLASEAGFLEIADNPVLFHGKHVNVIGVIGFTSGGTYLYRDFESFSRGDYNRVFDIERRKTNDGKPISLSTDVLFELQGKCVSVAGYVHSESSKLVGDHPKIRAVDLNQSYAKLSETAQSCSY